MQIGSNASGFYSCMHVPLLFAAVAFVISTKRCKYRLPVYFSVALCMLIVCVPFCMCESVLVTFVTEG